MTERRQHPTLSDVALALATRHSDPVTKVSLVRNAAGNVQVGLDHSDTDAKQATDTASKLFDVLCAKYPRENGGNA